MREILLVRLFCKECVDNLAKLLDFAIQRPKVNHEHPYTEEGHIYLIGAVSLTDRKFRERLKKNLNEKKHKEE